MLLPVPERCYDQTMAWVNPAYSRKRVAASGERLADYFSDLDAEWSAGLDSDLIVLDNWRSAHAFPLNTLQVTLRQRARKVWKNAIIAQRLKRLPSIVAKLCREPGMNLARMQDIGGCRAVLQNATQLAELVQTYESARTQHKFVRKYDYIDEPKRSGYRGIHFVYKYISRGPAQAPFRGLRIEIQMRSALQHAWATSVEAVATLLRHPLKASEGPQDWLEFFQIAGSAFALLEDSPTVPGTASTAGELASELRRRAEGLNAEYKLETYTRALKILDDESARTGRRGYFLLVLQPVLQRLSIERFPAERRGEATHAYLEREKHRAEDEDVVLVSADSFNALKRSYPNYFLDTRRFWVEIRRFLDV